MQPNLPVISVQVSVKVLRVKFLVEPFITIFWQNIARATYKQQIYYTLSKMLFAESGPMHVPTLTLTQMKCGLKVSLGGYNFTN